MDTRAKATAKDDVADGKRQRTEQEAQNSSSSLVEPMAISVPAQVPFDDRHNLEDLLIGPFNNAEQQTRLCQMGDVVVDGSK